MNASVTAVHRANNFDALRLFAALLVIWGHQFAIMGRPVPLILGGNEPGAVGVVMFFAISGYLVTLSWLADPHLLRFAARRALRIWPALCVVVLLCIVVLGPLVTTLPQAAYWKSAGTWDYLSNIWLKTRYALPGVFDGNPVASSVNGPLWTIPLEVTCYAILAALGVCGITRTRWSGPAIFLILLGYLQWHYMDRPGRPMPEWSPLLQYGIMFALGASLACLQAFWSSHRLIAAAVLIVALTLTRHYGPSVISGQAWLLMAAGLSVILGSACAPVLHRVGHFGDFSYGMYIYAFPVQQLVVWSFANRLGFTAAISLTVFCTLVLAALSWHWVEKPALSFKPRRRAAPSSSSDLATA